MMGWVRLTKVFSADQFARGLAGWDWIGLAGKAPVVASLFADVFCESSTGWWFLDTIEGTLRRCWATPAALDADLATTAGAERYLLGSVAVKASARGIALGPHEVFGFVPPPIVRGRLDIDSIQPVDFVAALNIAGQIHRQIRQAPVG